VRLTDKALAVLTLPKGKREAIFFDDDLAGFGVRLREGGAARWIYQYKIGAQNRRITLGSTTALTATRARASASELHAKVRLGADPGGEKAESRIRAGETLGALLEVYLEEQRQRIKPLSFTQKERHLRKHCRRLHGLQLVKVDRRTIAALLQTVATKSGPIESNRVRASLSAFFTWCISEGYAESNPVVGTNRRPEKSRDRVLSPAELKAIWAATAGDDDYSAIVRLLMLTGCRAEEIAGLRWSEIFGDMIVLPGTRTKNARDHIVPLSELARAILEARPKMLGCDFVFGRGKHRTRGFTGWSVCKVLLDGRIKANGAEVAHWTNHDLRRTCATSMAELGVQPHIIEAVLNHVSGYKHGVAGIYNRASYGPEKHAALILWADKLLEVVEGKARKVIRLRA
jgi:integrase